MSSYYVLFKVEKEDDEISNCGIIDNSSKNYL